MLALKGQVEIVGVATKKTSSFNSDFCDLAPFAKKSNISFLHTNDINSQEAIGFINKCNPDFICCLGWSSLIKEELLNLYPIIGYHPAELPKNRGRHPLIWALVLGLSQTASTYFLMDKGADSGDILSQEIVSIDFNDNARSMYDKLTSVALTQLQTLLLSINAQKHLDIREKLQTLARPQDHTQANIWRKRSREDGQIDFRMSSLAIYNLIRALSHPYPGAEVKYKNNLYKIWDSKIINYPHSNIESGKILEIQGNNILIKTYDGAIMLTSHELPQDIRVGEYL